MATPKCTPRIDFGAAFEVGRGLEGKSAIVTGAGSGIGESIVRALAEAGAHVTIAEWNEENGEAVAKSLREGGFQAQYHKTDVTKWDDLVSAFNAAITLSPNKTLDIVIPNAGVASNALIPWLNNAPEDEKGNPLQPSQSVVDINFTAVYNTALLAMYMFKKYPSPSLPETTKPPSKQLIFVGSMASYQGMTGVPSYGGAKFGVRGIFKAMRDLAPDVLGEGRERVRVNMIAPSWIRSRMTGGILSVLEGRGVMVGVPGDCAGVVMRIVGDEGVVGRAAAVLGGGGSFDLCDDYDGLEGTREILEAYKRGAFTHRPTEESEKKEKELKIEELIPNDKEKEKNNIAV